MTKEEKYKLVEAFIIENQHSYYRLAFSYVKNKEDALDIVQESIVKALKSIDYIEQIEYIKTWFYRILINTSIDYIKRNKRTIASPDEILDFHLPNQEINLHDLDLYDAIDHLPITYKTIIILRFFEDMKIDDIAEMLGENSNTIKTRLYAALRKLRIEMKEDVES
ncbi:sigma-70 family RNA polymerase sigma factor [Viridibacillus sp. FSL E2-0187]|jgi:RNA polymerase sigma-70 factor (ECF subfamily)|uniref:RNA polymerase sigma factor n=1 Tax=Viridibacillus arvi TaxID=263475 RepID=A0A0M0L8Y0_9BACL|nr:MULTISPECIES: sigma-70 family RNA polymerase sigma factor [Viridibacillus]KOO47327.1 RNA polymerase subunit sigma-70 [Viridibacillus arvi]QOV09606.1 sigma-70 family RNA polymerase sigma factor [Viridibacillus sp. JNUCC-6]